MWYVFKKSNWYKSHMTIEKQVLKNNEVIIRRLTLFRCISKNRNSAAVFWGAIDILDEEVLVLVVLEFEFVVSFGVSISALTASCKACLSFFDFFFFLKENKKKKKKYNEEELVIKLYFLILMRTFLYSFFYFIYFFFLG